MAVAPIAVGDGDLHRVTVSVGVSGMPSVCADVAGLVPAADRALDAAKGAGRDRIACADAPVPA